MSTLGIKFIDWNQFVTPSPEFITAMSHCFLSKLGALVILHTRFGHMRHVSWINQ